MSLIDSAHAQSLIDKDLIDRLPGASLTLNGTLSSVVSTGLTIIAITAFAGLIYSGFMYITSNGDTGKVETARKNIVWSLTGVILAMLSYLIIQFIAGLPEADFNSNNNGGGAGGGNTGGVTSPKVQVIGSLGSSITSYPIDNPSQGFTTQLYVTLDSKPTSNQTISASLSGDLTMTLLDTDLVFTPDNYNVKQPIRVTYAGKNTFGKSVLKIGSGTNAHQVTFEVILGGNNAN